MAPSSQGDDSSLLFALNEIRDVSNKAKQGDASATTSSEQPGLYFSRGGQSQDLKRMLPSAKLLSGSEETFLCIIMYLNRLPPSGPWAGIRDFLIISAFSGSLSSLGCFGLVVTSLIS